MRLQLPIGLWGFGYGGSQLAAAMGNIPNFPTTGHITAYMSTGCFPGSFCNKGPSFGSRWFQQLPEHCQKLGEVWDTR